MDQSSIKKSFIAAFDTYGDAIFRFCLVKTGNRELSEDLTQETFTRYWQSLRDGREMTNTRSFLYTTASHLVIDWYRKKKEDSLDARMDRGFEPRDTNTLGAELGAEYAEVLRAIDGMEGKDKEVLLLRYVEELEPKDIAHIMDESTNVISVRIHRATKRLQEKLDI